jgi:hypothetical protein
MISALQTIATPWHNRRYVGRHRAEDLVATPRNTSPRWRTALPLGLIRPAAPPAAGPAAEAAPTATGD